MKRLAYDYGDTWEAVLDFYKKRGVEELLQDIEIAINDDYEWEELLYNLFFHNGLDK